MAVLLGDRVWCGDTPGGLTLYTERGRNGHETRCVWRQRAGTLALSVKHPIGDPLSMGHLIRHDLRVFYGGIYITPLSSNECLKLALRIKEMVKISIELK